jgi:maleate isomerase
VVTRPLRIGLIVPSSNTTMETELPALLARRELAGRPERFTFHAARARMRHVTPEELDAMNAQTVRAAAELADLRPDVVATACLVAIMAQGAGFHCTAEEQIRTALAQEGADPPVVSSAGALLAALEALGARRVALVTPYVKSLTERVVGYLESAGLEVQDALSLEVADNRAVASLEPTDLLGHQRRLDLSGCDALVLSACVQMQSLPVLDAVERACGLPTVSAATATTWALLRELDLEPAIPGAGTLLAAGAGSVAEA